MIKTTLAAGTVLASVLAASPAAAQLFAPSGPRVELQAGLDSAKANSDFGAEYEAEGGYIAIGAGYDVSLGVVALGIDVEAGKSGIEDSVVFEEDGVVYDSVLTNTSDLYIGGRLTVPVATLGDVYVKAGLTRLENELDLIIDDGETQIREIVTDDENGYRIGAGGRYYIGRGAYIGGEYRYADYDSDIEKHQIVGTLGISF